MTSYLLLAHVSHIQEHVHSDKLATDVVEVEPEGNSRQVEPLRSGLAGVVVVNKFPPSDGVDTGGRHRFKHGVRWQGLAIIDQVEPLTIRSY